jgi:hypothetical protein
MADDREKQTDDEISRGDEQIRGGAADTAGEDEEFDDLDELDADADADDDDIEEE